MEEDEEKGQEELEVDVKEKKEGRGIRKSRRAETRRRWKKGNKWRKMRMVKGNEWIKR